MKNEVKRNFKIDIMKVIGLLGIIFAHMNSNNNFLIQFRSFDVPMLVFISGYLSYKSYNPKAINKKNVFKIKIINLNYFKYILKRIKRLLIPTYIFLLFYFTILIFNKYIFNINFPYSFNQVKESFLLLDGIGYVWIVRVYLLSALFIPFMVILMNKININRMYFLVFLILFFHEILYFLGFYNLNFINKYYLSYLIPYSSIMALGLLSNKTDKKHKIIILLLFLTIYFSLALYYNKINGYYLMTNKLKYSPMIYYLSYSMSFTYFFLLLDFKIKIPSLLKRVIQFISKSSFWIYLWHIFSIYIFNLLIPNLNWIIMYILVLLLSIIITYVQNIIINKLEEKNIILNLNNFLCFFKG